ncbi:hypothetical protein GR210_30035 [Rhizobium leguminosarum]|uniref:hypothetical protein n=1 Tax=Rhizobium leguminosarum TaxID=384 RepID=UPI0013DCC359|nr:hypothetical protein [Rhizobium leguminosarum]MBY3044745.1 hypothetical protein [Rhizobium leguminosarum]MBY5317792.1 hypothetical protein [Rhizobium leguminosarum]NEH53012.1 hypothetical protein [Rhizobium leguminosarum]
MGRIAGPVRDPWKIQVNQRRREKERLNGWTPPVAPIVHPPAKRRQIALLWYIARFFTDGMMIGVKGWPPLTPDMRVLLAKKQLSLARYHACRNRVKVTQAGIEALNNATPAYQDQYYIILATHTRSVR